MEEPCINEVLEDVERRLLWQTKIPGRFQVSLPTPLAPIAVFVIPENQALVEPAYKAAMFAELDKIIAAIPPDKLAIQWDVAIEFALWEGVSPLYLDKVETAGQVGTNPTLQAPLLHLGKAGILERLVELGNRVSANVELGYHLCYGDAGHRHFKEPEDTANLVEVANAISSGVKRELNWRNWVEQGFSKALEKECGLLL
jgi:hypothetical protein